MASFEYRADGHHVDDAGNLIACTYVDRVDARIDETNSGSTPSGETSPSCETAPAPLRELCPHS